jgi:transcriptional regulator with XRE-family HTH domain
MKELKNLGRIIRSIRQSKKMTLIDLQLAYNHRFHTKISHATFSNWERGNTEPSVIGLHRLSLILNYDFLEEFSLKNRLKKEEGK